MGLIEPRGGCYYELDGRLAFSAMSEPPLSSQSVPAASPRGSSSPAPTPDSQSPTPNPPSCGRWRLKPFELIRPVLLRPSGPLTLGEFLAQPDPAVAAEFRALTVEQRQALVLARLKDAPADRPISLFGQDGYTFADARQAIEDGSPLGVRLIEAECKLVGLLLDEALGYGDPATSPGGSTLTRDDVG